MRPRDQTSYSLNQHQLTEEVLVKRPTTLRLGIGTLLFVSAGLFSLSDVFAEVPNLSTAQLTKSATHVFTGTVQALYSYDKTVQNLHGEHVTAHYAAEVFVDAVEKGDGIEPRSLVYVRLWRAKKSPQGYVGSSGHGIPKTKQVRVYLKRAKDGGLDVILPNGLQSAE
jgi:hypothetical protein